MRSTKPENPPETAGQNAVLDFLAGRHRNGAVKRIDTHASIVFLEPDRVLKIKRAVCLPFLDYSTLEKRKRACEEELAVNQRYAPALYRRVLPITRGAAGPEIGGTGPPIEWAVEMARFDERQTLDHLAAIDEVAPELADALAEVMRASHADAPVADRSEWPASVAGIIDRNTKKFRGQTALAGEAVERLHALSHRQLAEHLPLMKQRAEAGLVRHCHGDAHLGNIVLVGGKPVLFDAIEFDPAIATTDVLYDLAFPIMDLIHFGRYVAANRLFNDYLQPAWREHADALGLLPLFLSIRAAIRAHVLFTTCEQSHNDAAPIAQAKSYFDLALELIAPGAPSLIAIGGRSGTGKTALARSLAGLVTPLPGAVILRSDVIRKELFGVDALVALPATAYNSETSARVYRTMAERARAIIGQGLSVILDAAFLREAERNALALAAHETGTAFRPVFLSLDCDERLKRVASRRRDASDATRDVALQQESIDIGRMDWPQVDASGSPKETIERSVPHLGPAIRGPR
ncbi:bifunctional aminoglycoside phosphotransferase/ATP-binding protein [Bradyrhizobium sp. dw_78]|uniref:bifunctional aminoglycoside phosphotransferase/ATP-binding protein n=1 Tax=Bradyrhizobium sp. dw_78 TaxID=2719793 RepID=UPI001BD28E4F|nr:bifunctional aminoglycoside phosphotransferase/ATP-binding protein [Bradyrhizobium sp. dw_78]